MPDLFDPLRMGDLELANRILLAPMTHSRADARGVINASARDYYGLRSGAGLLITEGVNVRPMSNAFDRTPGLDAGPVDARASRRLEAHRQPCPRQGRPHRGAALAWRKGQRARPSRRPAPQGNRI